MNYPAGVTPQLRVDRKRGADLVTNNIFPVTDRKIRDWPLPWEYINGRAVISVEKLFACADRILREASHEPTRSAAQARLAKRSKRSSVQPASAA